jgi:PAS domain S-box-containing protein
LKTFGYESRESFFSIHVSSLYADPKERPKILSLINKEEYIKDYPLLLKRKDGTLIDTLINTAPVRNPDGSIKSFIGSIQDISHRARAEEALQQSNKKLILLTGLVQHDIMNLLTEIYITHDLALKSEDPDTRRIYMACCHDIGKRIESIIEFTRDFEKCDRFSTDWQAIFSVIESAIREVKPGRIIIGNQVSPSLEIYADPIIHKVFSTLLENAIRYGKTLSKIWLYASDQNGDLILTCEDDGIGIPIEDKERVFSHESGKNKDIGLFLSREIILINGFSIREYGTPGKGAKFEIVVPHRKWRNISRDKGD